MSRNHDTTGRSRKSRRFLMLEHYLLNSPAWQSLSPVARSVYIEIAKLYVPGNNGKIGMSARRLAELLPASRQTYNRALVELREKGFIEALRRGGFNMKSGSRRASEWRLTSYKCDVTGAVASKSFTRWKSR